MCAVCRKPRGKAEYLGWTVYFPDAPFDMNRSREFCGRECGKLFHAYAHKNGMEGAFAVF